MAKNYLLSVQAAPLFLCVGLVMMLLVYAGNQSDRSRGSELEGETRSVSMTLAVYGNFDKTLATATVSASVCFNEDPSPTLEQFVDPLPIIPHVNISDGQQHVVRAYKTTQAFHRDLPPTTVYAFGTSQSKARVPGPALIAKRNVPSYIRWENRIPDEHILPIDGTLITASFPAQRVPIVPHLHGMESQSIYDGHPEAWFTKLGDTGSTYVTQNYIYPNTLLPAMIWYHDHTVGITRVNVVAGLAGPYIVRGEANEEPAGLPHGDREIILFLQDKRFYPDGSINFPNVGDDTTIHPNWCPGYYGDTIMVNGKIWPYLDVLPHKYRLRILNGASDRYFRLSLDKEGMTFLKIGTDGGYLSAPVIIDSITLSPSERVDVIVDFGGLPNGTRIVLNNSAPAPFPGGPGFPPFDPASGESAVLQFRVGPTSSKDTTIVPSNLGANFGGNKTVFTLADGIRVRRFALTEMINNIGNGTELLLANRTWDSPATEFVPLMTTEVWEFIGLTPGIDHPIHIHLIKFQLLSVQLFNVSSYNDKTCQIQLSYGHPGSCFLNVSRGPNLQEIGWKDTISAESGAVTRIVIRFSSQNGDFFPFDPTVGPGYLWHCHLLSHEDNSMMRPMFIQPDNFRPDPDTFNTSSGSRR